MSAPLSSSSPVRLWVPGANLSDNARKARYGVAYVRAIASQAGWQLKETSPDEDTEAIDLTVEMAEGPIHVQVKCGTRDSRAAHITLPVEQAWLTKWSTKRLPVYLVYVRVAPDPKSWLIHSAASTRHASLAHWMRVDGLPHQVSIKIPKANRFTADTLSIWRDDFLDCFQTTVAVG